MLNSCSDRGRLYDPSAEYDHRGSEKLINKVLSKFMSTFYDFFYGVVELLYHDTAQVFFSEWLWCGVAEMLASRSRTEMATISICLRCPHIDVYDGIFYFLFSPLHLGFSFPLLLHRWCGVCGIQPGPLFRLIPSTNSTCPMRIKTARDSADNAL